ncbi:MAG TPA: hypothetical protein VGH40_11370 [Roseiarcus sp.]|jgi:hypothetical protein
MRNILIGVVSSAAMGAAMLATAAPAWADNDVWVPGNSYGAPSDGNAGPGPYGIGGPGTGKAVAEWAPSYGYGDTGYSYGYGAPPGYRPPSDGNAGPGPYGIGGPGTGKVVAY